MAAIVTLITGADKGIGFAAAQALGSRGQTILIGARSEEKGKAAVAKLTSQSIQCEWVQIDVTNQESIDAAVKYVADHYGYLTTLVNNAGIALDAHRSLIDLPLTDIRKDFEVNFFGSIAVTKAFIPLLRNAAHAQIINVSSEMGSLGIISDKNSPFYRGHSIGYQSSKAALNAATITLAKELAPIRVNSVNPGYTHTDFGGGNSGGHSPSVGAEPIVSLASEPDSTQTSTFMGKDGPLPW